MKTTIQFEIDSSELPIVSDEYLAELWYIAQANPAPTEDKTAGAIAECVGREIIARWIRSTEIPLWSHQGKHAWMTIFSNQSAAGDA